jgi:flagellar assembly protein FliH
MASVLKQDGLLRGTATACPVAFNVEDVQSKARDFLAEVQQQAATILNQARQDADKIRVQAKQEGLRDAQKQIEETANRLSDQRCRTAIAGCNQSVDQLNEATTQWLAQWRIQTVELAARIAEKLVRREMASNNELLRVWMEEAIVALRDERDLRVLVHPDDFSIAGRFLQSMAKSVTHAASVEIIPDPEIRPGGCIVRSKHGQIDQQLETQLERLADQLNN